MLDVLASIPWPLAVILFFVFLFALTAVVGSGSDAALSKDFAWQFRLAAACRTPLLMYIVVPLSFLQRKYVSFRRQLRLLTRGAGGKAAFERHEANVASIVEQIEAWNKAGRQRTLRTARPNWASMSLKLGSNKGASHLVKTGHMNEILRVDADNLALVAEPGVTMGELTDVLCPLGLALQTHVEMESITLGGIAMGFGIETNSHRFGLFQESVLEYEFVDSRGVRHSVTADSDPKLFYALPWSHGTLGFLTKLSVRLVRTKPFIKLIYEPTSTPEELTQRLDALAALPPSESPDFLEATLYDANRAVIQAGWYTDTEDIPKGEPISYVNSFYKPFFFRHVETFLDSPQPVAEYIPLKHFLHRFTRSIFWELEDMIPFSNHPLYRCLWGWLGAPEVSLLKLVQGPVIRRSSVYAHVVQESIMPIRRLPEGIRKFDDWFGAYPLLVFPVRIFNRGEHSGMLKPRPEECEPPNRASGLWVDLGAYGVPRDVKQGQVWDAKSSVRAMEHWTRDAGGFQALYTDIFCTPLELREMFDFTLMDAARKRLGGDDAFPEVYDKVRSEDGISDLSVELAAEKAAGKTVDGKKGK